MRLIVLAIVTGVLSGCSAGYDNNDLELVVAYSAKDLCSCLWVMGQTEDYCRRWTAASPAVAKTSIDYDEHIVEARALLMWRRRAQWQNDRHGCALLDD